VTRRNQSRTAAGLSCAGAARELAVPVPFTMDGLRSRLQDRAGRAVQVAPAALEPGAPSGLWFRMAGVDYLYYERLTSPFHQAHIVLHLAAHLLLSDQTGPPVLDRRLAPDVSPELVRIMLGDTAPSPVSHRDAETFAFLALEAASPTVTRAAARRLLRQLAPLRSDLLRAVPQAAGSRPAEPRHRLYQAVVEIREAALVLRPYQDQQNSAAAGAARQGSTLAGSESAARAEAAGLAQAIRAARASFPRRPEASAVPIFVPGADLASEAAWLARVSRAIARCRPGGRAGGSWVPRIAPGGDWPGG
jgi:hypothetical protein